MMSNVESLKGHIALQSLLSLYGVQSLQVKRSI